MAEQNRHKEHVVGDSINRLDNSIEKVRNLVKDVYNANLTEDQIRDKDIYIRAALGSKLIIDRIYKHYVMLYRGRFTPSQRCFMQLANEIQFYDWLQNKLNDIYIAEYQANVNRFGDAQDLEKPIVHRGKRTKEEQLAIDKWNWLHPDDPIENQYEKRYKKQK